MSEFVTYLHEVLLEFGSINTRKMFGGHGVYHHDLMFALVIDDELYLKADKLSVEEFEDNGLEAFIYMKKDKPYRMSYYQAPEIIFDDPEEARRWADLAYAAAVRAQSKNPKKTLK